MFRCLHHTRLSSVSVRAAAGRAVRLVSIRSGAFTLARAGLLDGCRVTTHWLVCHLLAQMFPAVQYPPKFGRTSLALADAVRLRTTGTIPGSKPRE